MSIVLGGRLAFDCSIDFTEAKEWLADMFFVNAVLVLVSMSQTIVSCGKRVKRLLQSQSGCSRRDKEAVDGMWLWPGIFESE